MSATLLGLMEWADTLQTNATELVMGSTTSDPIEQIAKDVVQAASAVERQLLLKSVQEALYYCVGFANNLAAPQIAASVKRWLGHHGSRALLQRFLSLYFFNAVWFYTSNLFRGQAITADALERDMQQLELVCQNAIALAYQHTRTLDAAGADQLLRDIEQRLRSSYATSTEST